ncbi:MAG: hypothetical protein R3C10_15100 [Pirellulales bacterium]
MFGLLVSLSARADDQHTAVPIDIGSRRELFVDDHLIERMTGAIELVLHHPTPREVVVVHDAPWEGSGGGYHTIFRDGERYRMYYHAWQILNDEGTAVTPYRLTIGYLESPDGIHWTKPNLGLHEFDGSTENNIVWTGNKAHDLNPFIDTNPAAAPEGRYKAIGLELDPHELRAYQSPDGIHWSVMKEAPIMTTGAFDTQNVAFWDDARGEYRAYIRDFKDGIRDIRTATSQDFLNWTEPVWLDYGDAPVEHLYTNQVRPYYRAPHIYIGFPSRYTERTWGESSRQLPGWQWREKRHGVSPRYGTAVTDALLMTSRDGLHFRRWGEAFLRPGMRDNNWAYGDNYIAWQAVETVSDAPGQPPELSLYATEDYFTGKSSQLRRYTLRLDGFVSAQAKLAGGELVTKPLTFTGNRLSLNYATSGRQYPRRTSNTRRRTDRGLCGRLRRNLRRPARPHGQLVGQSRPRSTRRHTAVPATGPQRRRRLFVSV